MGRYRPPQPKSSPYISRGGFEKLQAEQEAIWERRKHVTEALSAAAAEGDRSENAEYIYRKKELRELDRRIRYLQKRLPDLQIVDRKPSGDGVFFGATVKLETDKGEQVVTLVGPDEIDPKKNYISIDSPLARALRGKSVDDEVMIEVDGVKQYFEIVGVKYLDI